MQKMIIDCDPGIDDALALLLALGSPEFEIVGITTVSGNVPADLGAQNARKILKQAGRLEIPVYIGEMRPMEGDYVDAMDTHGRDGLGESFLPEVPGPFPQKGAVEFLEECLEREEISRTSIEANGKIIVARSLTQAAAVANRIAPEHLELSVDNPFDYLGLIENAGSIFLGRYNPEPMGDYFAGPNHTLPTMGTARFYSPLSVDDFIKKSQFSYYTREALERDYRKVSRFAKEEGLTAHARAVDIRFEKEGEA